MPTLEDIQKINFGAIKNSYDKYIVRPLNQFGVGGFVFTIDKEKTVTLKSDITDHYVENNTAVQDHIALKPLSITLKGFVAELQFDDKNPINSATQEVTQKLTTLDAYLPEITAGANQVKDLIANEDLTFENISATTLDLWSLTKNLNPSANVLQQAYLYFKALRDEKILVSLETPFEFLTNMAIEQIIAIEPEDTKTIMDFSITLKQIRFVETEIVTFDVEKYQSRTNEQREDVQNKGTALGSKVPDPSILIQLGNYAAGALL